MGLNASKLAFDARVLRAGNEAVGAWARLLAWSADHETDGVVSPEVMALVTRRRAVLARLLEVGLVERAGDDFVVQELVVEARPAPERVAAISDARRRAGLAGAAARWGARPAADLAPVCHPAPMANGCDLPMANDGKTDAVAIGKASGSQTETESQSTPDLSQISKIGEGEGVGCGSALQVARAPEPDGKPVAFAIPADEPPEVLAVLELLRGARALGPIATLNFARHAATWCIGANGGRLELADLLGALTALDEKLAGVRAAGDPPLAREQLARQAVGFIRGARRGEARAAAARAEAAPGSAAPRATADERSAARRALETFRRVWEARRGHGRYVLAPPAAGYEGDEAAALVVARLASQEAEIAQRDIKPKNPLQELEGELVEHWTKAYLADTGRQNFLLEKRHPFRYLGGSLSSYGWPASWSRRAPRSPVPLESGVFGPPPSAALDAMRAIARGPAAARPAEPQRETGT